MSNAEKILQAISSDIDDKVKAKINEVLSFYDKASHDRQLEVLYHLGLKKSANRVELVEALDNYEMLFDEAGLNKIILHLTTTR